MLFIYPTPQYPRRPLEYVYKSIYLFTNVIHIVAMVVLIADFYTRLRDSMPSYFSKAELVVSPVISMVMDNCTYSGELHLGSVKGTVDVNYGAVVIGLMNMAMYVQGLFVLEFLLIVNNLICAQNYSSGDRHLRCFGVHVPFYHITVVFTYVYSIAITVLTWVYEGNRTFYHRALVHCANQLAAANPSALVDAEYGDYSIFTTAVYWPFGAVCFSTLVYLSATIILVVKSYDKATRLLSEADAPWEARGVMATTKKPLLKLHTAQRNAIVEDARNAIKQGEKVRIVRSYQLMTEEDFDALVQAMRDQVSRAIKEKQFEMMRQNFGDRESEIDDMGFLWRQPLMAADPNATTTGGGEEDQLYDVNFGDYFTDNDYNDVGNNGLDGGMGGPRGIGAGGGLGGGELNQLGSDGMPLQSPEELVEYTNDPLFPPDEDFGETGLHGESGPDMGFDGPPPPPPYYVDGSGGPGVVEDEDGGPYGEYDASMDNPDTDPRLYHHRHRRRRSRRLAEPDEEPSYRDYEEPDPRLPPVDEYSPQEGGRGLIDYDWSGGDGGGNGGGGRQDRRNRKRRGGSGRQAEVEDDLVEADALSGESGLY